MTRAPHTAAVDALLLSSIDDRFKGVPPHTPPFALGEIGNQGWSLRNCDLPLPVLVARASALEHNIARMQRYCDQHGVELAPHGKTTMAPQVLRRQLDAGAWGITAATVEQLAVYRHYGFRRIILANQVAGTANLRAIAEELRRNDELELLVFVDSATGVLDLEHAARAAALKRPVDVLLEVGYPGGRTGTRDCRTAEELAVLVDHSPHVRLRGVAAFEGLLPNELDRQSPAVSSFLADMAEVIDALIRAHRLPPQFIVSAGGSAVFDLVVEAFADRWPGRARVILRSGCYVTHDHGLYAATSPLARADDPLRPALELWSYVQSRPERELAYATFGRRDAPYDSGLPTPLALVRRGERERRAAEGIVVESLNDQHARLRVASDSEVAVGDVLICGVSHPCSGFDRWRLVMLVDDDDRVADGLLTFF